jgi:hypothetical protein
VEQPQLAKLEIPRQMKAEKIVPQGVRNKIDKFDLILHIDASMMVRHLSAGQAAPTQQWPQLDSRGLRSRVC